MKDKVILAALFIASVLLLLLGDKAWLMYFVFFLSYMIFVLTKKIKERKNAKDVKKKRLSFEG